MLLTSQVFVVLVELYTLNGERPPQFSGTWQQQYVPCQIVRENLAVIDNLYLYGGLCFECFVSLHARGLPLQTAGRRVLNCIHDHSSFRTGAGSTPGSNHCSQ